MNGSGRKQRINGTPSTLTPEICLAAAMLIKEYEINPFDAYHAATAMTEDKTILSTEHVYDRIKGVTRIDPETYAKQL